MILDKVNNPKDLKALNTEEKIELAKEIRELIIKKVNTTGGHMAPNLGIVETTIALHTVFDSPKDKIIFDVSHQCYTHKILTGRKDGFSDIKNFDKYTGYTAPVESEHDIFQVGHTSTSVSLAVGTAKARDLVNGKGNVIALIGDGSLSGGEAYEGLNNAATLNSNIIIIVNDNEMSIAENQGGLYENLRVLRETQGKAESNFFKTLGFEYLYIEEGNNIKKLTDIFTKVKDISKPIVLHIRTLKGKGLVQAENNKEKFHWVMPGILDENTNTNTQEENYYTITTDFILNKAQKDKSIVAITPATPGAYGFTQEFREKLGSQFVDVGIAEEHAIAYASALAKNGAKPILAVMSSFVQRTYDQLVQDLCLNNSPATILVFWGAISNADATHLGVFDMSMMCNIPNLVCLAPTNKEEYLGMLEWSTEQKEHPVVIRVPFIPLESTGIKDETDYSNINKSKVIEKGEKIAILGLGNFLNKAKELSKDITETIGIKPTLINPVYYSGLDKELLNSLKNNHKIIITLEDGIIEGGFGQKVASFLGNSNVKVLNYGAQKEFTDRIPIDELYTKYRLTKELIIEDIKNALE